MSASFGWAKKLTIHVRNCLAIAARNRVRSCVRVLLIHIVTFTGACRLSIAAYELICDVLLVHLCLEHGKLIIIQLAWLAMA
tara:strand:- start:273 stop:518 length:246 start_codon:yes stop_codon:yes gene_type:complete